MATGAGGDWHSHPSAPWPADASSDGPPTGQAISHADVERAGLALLTWAFSAAGTARPARAEVLYTLKDLGTFGGSTSFGNAVNDAGQVTGESNTADGAIHAFLSGLDGVGPLKDLGTLGGSISIGLAVNAAGQVVGRSSFTAGSAATHAFLYTGGQMLDLNSLIVPGSGLTLIEAQGISDTGYITGFGQAPDGSGHAFLLTPVPEPSHLVLLGTGAVGLLGYGAWRRRTGLRSSIGRPAE